MTDKSVSAAAAAMARRGRGIPKRLSLQERARRRAWAKGIYARRRAAAAKQGNNS